jgi:DNA helicase II / ATP-dependent DNA helicase PcrA
VTSDPFALTDDAVEPISRRAMAAAAPRYLEGLNESQRAAVEAKEGPVLVLAGAGTGKTRVLTTRLAHILATRRAWPSQILAVTFTNKAAREMKERVAHQVGGAVEGLWLGTFHSLCARLLRRHAELVGLTPNFTILDQDDQIRLVLQILRAENLDEKRWPARALHTIIERWKDKGLAPDKVPAAEAGDFANGKTVSLYRQYQERLRVLNAADFGDLLLHAITIFTTQPEVARKYQDQFRYLLVDEYQDTNVAQYLWLRLLAQGSRNICCVGDDDQSIYSWRGAEIGNILRFERDFPGAKVIRLEQNYRSTQNILTAASGLIAKNSGRLGKTLWSQGEAGAKVLVRGLWDGEEEARVIGDEVEAQQRAGHKLAEMAILVRAGFQTREFEERFLTLGVPYRVVGGPRFYERQEIRDAIAYLRLVQSPSDSLAFERIINVPRRGIGDTTVQALHKLSRAESISLIEAARRLTATEELKPHTRKALSAFLADLDRWRAQAQGERHPDLARIVLDESGYTAMWKAAKTPEAPGRLDNLKEFVAAMEEFENLGGFLEHVSLVAENAEQAGSDLVSIMTLHAAKGLEFETVFLAGWEEGLFPHQRAMDEGGTAALEEERRLAYVGLTRAKKRAIVSFVANRRVHNMWQSAIPSRFIDELPVEAVEVASEPGLYAGKRRMDTGVRFEEEHTEPPSYRAPVWRGARWRDREETPKGPKYQGPLITAKAKPVPAGAKTSPFGVGERVFHQKFGYGEVLAADEDRLEIEFEKAGRKKVVASFVEPAGKP